MFTTLVNKSSLAPVEELPSATRAETVRPDPSPAGHTCVGLSGCLSVCLSVRPSGHPAIRPSGHRTAGEPWPSHHTLAHDTLSLRCNRMDSYQSVLSVVTVCQAASACWRSRTSVSAW